MKQTELKEFLDVKVLEYNRPEFIESDPIQIPHFFNKKEDIEISGFLTATIAWGNRKSIINNAKRMMEYMDHSPFDFVKNHREQDLQSLLPFVHRTFNGTDFITFVKGLQHIYNNHHGLEQVFSVANKQTSLQAAIHHFKKVFFEIEHLPRTQKHVSDPLKNSAAKRINMFLRWMVRTDQTGVDFGIWKTLSPSQLSCPLDVHSGNVARKLGLLKRKQNDAKALRELDENLRILDSTDPVKYDFALFGLGVFEGF
ncbi:MAG: TIGR02757 family protein [Xanthomarina sp.]|uniref:TIGR02757 family protein n=1 Tax=Xanthomarina sp. TaxID=1931211 RepID=UPI000C4A1EB6|nr:TIGR02757 family protein [Xanthomarina sp.]MBF60378.1 TIGR02757 family protein [Xanthomarina sp.]HAB28976.1 TIGR02757 family protein [Xanthomarina gelatinilytica]HAI18921.1 TIGR02757 family protein [Xanthomarina gelatinilytica]